MKKHFRLLLIVFGALSTTQGMAQKLNLNDAIRIAQENSYSAQAAQFSFMASYWNWRSFKAQLLPAVNLNGYLAGFDHSLVETQKYVDGQVVTDIGNINKMQNYMTLSIDQQIPATGGKISLQSYLRRLDQFSYDETTWTTNPIRISYTQPLKTYNSLKWDKKIAPIEYQIAQRNYLSAMQDIAIRVTTLFFNVLEAQSNYKMSVAKLAERDTLLVTAKRRLALGTMSKSDVLQLELSQLNARVAVNSNRLTLEDRMYSFFSYLRVTDYEQAELIPPYYVPEVLLSAEEVLEKAIANSAHTLEQRQAILSAEQSLAQAKSNKGLQLTLQSQLGLTQSSNKLSRAYQNPLDNEIIGLSLSLPIFDWGVSKGRVRMAKSRLDMVRTQQEQQHLDYVQELRRQVLQFNMLPSQCQNAMRAQEIAEERYSITLRRFENGAVSVTELNTAQQELESAKAQYINQLETFWYDYYALQKSTLHDWINHIDLSVDFDELTK